MAYNHKNPKGKNGGGNALNVKNDMHFGTGKNFNWYSNSFFFS